MERWLVFWITSWASLHTPWTLVQWPPSSGCLRSEKRWEEDDLICLCKKLLHGNLWFLDNFGSCIQGFMVHWYKWDSSDFTTSANVQVLFLLKNYQGPWCLCQNCWIYSCVNRKSMCFNCSDCFKAVFCSSVNVVWRTTYGTHGRCGHIVFMA